MKKETFFDYKNWICQSPKKNASFFKGVNPLLLAKKCQFFLYLNLINLIDQSKPRNNAFWHCREKKFFCPKKQNFSKPKKSAFPKGLTYAFRQKMPFSLYLDLVNIRLEIMVNYFEETKETFLTIKNRIFQSSKNALFQRG